MYIQVYMNYITTTELRTKSPSLVRSLLAGESVSLMHRSQIIGEIKPIKKSPKVMLKKDIQELIILARKMNLPELSYKEREKKYRKQLIKKYGKALS